MIDGLHSLSENDVMAGPQLRLPIPCEHAGAEARTLQVLLDNGAFVEAKPVYLVGPPIEMALPSKGGHLAGEDAFFGVLRCFEEDGPVLTDAERLQRLVSRTRSAAPGARAFAR